MKINRYLKSAALLTLGIAFASASSQAQTVVTYSITNTFPNGGVGTPVTGGGTPVASCIFWYSIYQDWDGAAYNLPMTNDPSMDAGKGGADSGCLNMFLPWASAGGHADQSLVATAFGNQGVFDDSIEIPADLITQMSCDIFVAEPVTATSTGDATGNYGNMSFCLEYTYHSDNNAPGVPIPASASFHWQHMTWTVTTAYQNDFIANTSSDGNASGVGLYINDYGTGGSYPSANQQIYIDNIAATTSSTPPPPPPPPTVYPPVNYDIGGLNVIFVSSGSQYNREEVAAGNAGYGPLDAPTVTYSWTFGALPSSAHTAFQAHFFICQDDTGSEASNSSADYAAPNVIFTQVQRNADGSGTFNFRMKVHQKAGNGQLFAAPNPVFSITDPNPVGTWTMTFVGSVVTVTSPSGLQNTPYDCNIYEATQSSTFMADFSDPAVIQLGGQANNAADEGQDVIYTAFSLVGPSGAFSDNFVADAVGFDGGTAGLLAPWIAVGDANALQLIQAGDTNLLVTWDVNAHFDLQGSDSLLPPDYNYLTGLNTLGQNLTKFVFLGKSAVFVTPSNYGANNAPGYAPWPQNVFFRLEMDN